MAPVSGVLTRRRLLVAGIAIVAAAAVYAASLPTPPPLTGHRLIPWKPTPDGFFIYQNAAKTVRVQAEPAWIGVWPTELNATFHAEPSTSEKKFGLLVKKSGSDTAEFATFGKTVGGVLRSSSPNMTYLFFAKTTQAFADVGTLNLSILEQHAWPLTTTNATTNLTGATRLPLALAATDLSIDIAWTGIGTVTLADSGETERFQLTSGASDWALVDLPGAWSVTCAGPCIGSLRTTVTSWPGWT